MDPRQARFVAVWESLPIQRRWQIHKLTLLGRLASDPESAWLAVGLVRNTPWATFSRRTQVVVLVVLTTLGVAALIVGAAAPWALIVGAFVFHLAAWFAWITVFFTRALRLNDPIAAPPAGG